MALLTKEHCTRPLSQFITLLLLLLVVVIMMTMTMVVMMMMIATFAIAAVTISILMGTSRITDVVIDFILATMLDYTTVKLVPRF